MAPRIRTRTRRYIVRHNRERRRSLDKIMAVRLKPVKTPIFDLIAKAPCPTEPVVWDPAKSPIRHHSAVTA